MTRMLRIEPSDLQAGFSRAPFRVGHDLADHPLLQLDRIGDLADALPADHVEHNLGAVPDVLPGGEAPRLDATPGEIARGIHHNGCWMVVKFIESDPEYRALLNELLDEVDPLVPDAEGDTTRREGFIFLSAPNSTTPAHVDPEHNFLLQIQGSKTMVVGRFRTSAASSSSSSATTAAGIATWTRCSTPRRTSCWSRATASTCPCTPRTWCATARRPRSPCRSRGAPRRPSARRRRTRQRRPAPSGLSPAMPGRRPGADHVKALAARSMQGIQRRVGSRRWSGAMDVQVVDSRAGLASLAGAWDELAVAAGRPFCAPAWMLAWLDHAAAAGTAPRAIVVREGGELVALAPLVLAGRRLKLMAGGVSAGVDVVARRSARTTWPPQPAAPFRSSGRTCCTSTACPATRRGRRCWPEGRRTAT